MRVKEFFKNLGCGAVIGVAMIIPGVSGGTVAVLLNIYDKLINALGNLRKDFKANVAFLLPILIGLAAAFAAMYFPLKYALEHAPFPTVMLFVGLMVGSFPKLFKDSSAFGFKKCNTCSILLPFIAIIAICVLKLFVNAGEADLSANMPIWGYVAIIGIAMLASCALVIPGVSGSMLLMILGYYAPVLGLLSGIFTDFWHSALVLALFAVGLIVGFFSIAKLMKFFLEKYPRGTRWAIIGFVLGSIPAIFIVFDYAGSPMSGLQIAAGVVLCALGAVASYALTAYVEGKMKAAKHEQGDNK